MTRPKSFGSFTSAELWRMARLQLRAGSKDEAERAAAQRKLRTFRTTHGMAKIRAMQEQLGEERKRRRTRGKTP